MLNILFPRVCRGCGKKLFNNEELICALCRHDLPLACFHRSGDPMMKNLFYGRIPLEQATALLQFQKKGLTQKLLHELKYRGGESIGQLFGKWLGAELASRPEYSSVKLVIPVPLDRKKRKKRGYNQVSAFGNALASTLKVSFREDILIKKASGGSQVFKKRWGRFENEGKFLVHDFIPIQHKHVLLVDDIVTTGATMEKCAQELLKGEGVELSIASIAIA